ncbi:uncharacterized protein LOC128206425 [Mya arenaria]|uniref:uncharacterized protein LOC128206425 n=1 Tax=Mya arenaria TaxID=6604 RepID=UPI0022E66CF5|nr:uncharacterized protein LOC128206425 [Mya arenaria]
MTGFLQLLLFVSTTLASESSCPVCSKYDYEENLLERMIRMEFDFRKVLTENKVVSETVEHDLTKIKKENKRLYGEVDALKAEHEQAERRLVLLMEDVVRNQNITLEQAERRLVSLMEDVSTNSNNTLERITAAFDNITEQAERRLVSLMEDVSTNSNNTLELISAAFDNITDQIATRSVYFHAHSPQTSTLSTGEVIVYERVKTNQGNGYNATTGTFTAPAQGLYLFIMQKCSPPNKYSYLQIMKEGSGLLTSAHYDEDNHSCSSSQAFVQLDFGETVWIQCSRGGPNAQLYEDSNHWNSFGGALFHI